MNPILRHLPRWLNRLYAKALGYFWIPCPLCGRDFGGHELARESWRQGGAMFSLDLFVCWRCHDRAVEMNWANVQAWRRRATITAFAVPKSIVGCLSVPGEEPTDSVEEIES